jgi:predicted ATPase/Tfp pilus assembly protein PilF
MIGQGEVQLITLLGPGGIGKTRLAMQLASNQLQENNFPDGIYFVALEALSDSEQVPLVIAQTLGLSPQAKDESSSVVKTAIGNKHLLLVLDNFEQLMDGVMMVSELLESCPNLTLLVTSRERLNLEEEFVLTLQGLPVSKEANLAAAEANDAVKLFVQRAKRARLDFNLNTETLPHILGICHFVEGSPLGIELAAVWLRSLPLADIAKEIGHNIGALEAPSRNIAERHQSLRAVFEHSWKLLGPKEQTTLARLTVFADGFAREAASRVCEATIPLLTSLVDKSLLRLNAEGRYDFHPLLHQFGGEKLAELTEEKEQTRAKHARYFLALAEASSNQGTPAQLKPEQQNLLGALAWSQEEGQTLLGLRLGSALGSFWQAQGDLGEGIHWLRRVLSHPGAAAPSEERTNALLQAARIASMQGNRSLAQTYGQEALQLSQSLELEEHTVRAWLALAFEAHQQVDYAGGEKYTQAALKLARKIGHEELMAQSINALGVMLAEMDKSDLARPLFEESLALFRKLGRWPNVASSLSNLGYMVWIAGDLGAARAYLEEAVTMALDHHHLYIAALAQTNLGGVMQDLGDLAGARVLAGQVLESRWEQKDKEGLLHSLENFASLAVAQGEARRAVRLWGVAERLQQEINVPLPPFWLARHQQFVDMTKSQLDDASFSAAWQEGRRMELEDAVKWALKQG